MNDFTPTAIAMYESGSTLDQIAEAVHCSRAWVSRKLREAGVKFRKPNFRWSQEEDEILIANVQLSDTEIAALIPGRAEGSIKNRRCILGIVKRPDLSRKRWTEEDYAFIEANPDKTDSYLGKKLGVSNTSVRMARERIGGTKMYYCRVCNSQLPQQGAYCKEHLWVGRALRAYSSKAMVKGREFALTEERVFELVTSDCAYCGKAGRGIDRLDSSKGYVEGNVAPCCTRCNIAKNNMSVDDFISHINSIANHTRKQK